MAKRVLIIDDEVGSTRLLKANLEQTQRYEVRVVNRPEDALTAAREFRPHLVLLDIIMPRMPGGKVAAAFRADPELKGTPIVLFTAAVPRHQIQDAEGTLGVYPRIAKPATVEEIVKCIEGHLAK
jgi:CheY-like chemotaxis protein